MPRRKKVFGFSQFIIVAVLMVAVWIAADYYFNVYRHNPTETPDPEPVADVPAPPAQTAPPAQEELVPEDGFRLQTYRDEVLGFEFQYPVYAQGDAKCPSVEKTENGINLGMFFFAAAKKEGELSDFIENELQGMEIGKTENITVAGQPAVKLDYQTQGMGFNGSEVFVEYDGRIYEFGILANTTALTCGGVSDYADRVYRSVITTLKFTVNN